MSKKNLFREVSRALANLDYEYDYDISSASPDFCVHLLISINNAKLFSKLNKKIQTSNQTWIYAFIYTFRGLLALVACLDKLCMRKTTLLNSLIVLKCLSCIKEIMNSTYGMDSMISLMSEDVNSLQTLAKGKSLDVYI